MTALKSLALSAFFLVVAGLLIYAVFSLYALLRSNPGPGVFIKATVEKPLLVGGESEIER